AAPYRDRITRLDVGILGSHPSGRKDVGQEQDFVVLDAVVRDDQGSHVGERHAHVFGLSARIAAGEMAISEQTRSRLPIKLAPHVLLVRRIAVLAPGILVLLAVITPSA